MISKGNFGRAAFRSERTIRCNWERMQGFGSLHFMRFVAVPSQRRGRLELHGTLFGEVANGEGCRSDGGARRCFRGLRNRTGRQAVGEERERLWMEGSKGEADS